MSESFPAKVWRATSPRLDTYRTSRRQRKKIEMLFAHLKRILNLGRLRLRGPCGAHDELLLAAIAQNLRKLAKLLPCRREPQNPTIFFSQALNRRGLFHRIHP